MRFEGTTSHQIRTYVAESAPHKMVINSFRATIKNASAPMDSLLEQHSLTDLLTRLRAKIPEALETFAQLIEA
ncbi:MAG: hypothetical protein ACJ8R9_19960 [Steroidobacteraceae bacterium]